MASTNVIKSLQIKDNSGFTSPSFIGAEQCFVGPLRGSTVNNLEEQFVIGLDCITSSWIDEDAGIRRTTKEFYNADKANPKNYYILEIYEYIEGSASKAYIDYMPKGGDPEQGDILTLKLSNEEGHFDDGNKLYFESSIFKFNNDKSEVLISSNDLLNTLEELYFVNNVNNKILVSEKRIYNYVDDEGKKITKEVVTNHLS